MVKITYIEWNGEPHMIQAKLGQSVMEAAVKNAVPGIAADCGGTCACGTCRVYVDEAWRSQTGEASEMEKAMIEFADDQNPNVRLSCQMKITENLDGLVVRMPESQH
ncbi:MAG: 2Fe-2S iron-sulfur cluster-binding protein [Rhizomicrobium sp.]